MHGVVLRPPVRPTTGRLPTAAAPAESLKNIEQLMNEADPVKTLSQTGSVRMLKRLTSEAPALRPPGVAALPPIKIDTSTATPPASVIATTTPLGPAITPPRAAAIPLALAHLPGQRLRRRRGAQARAGPGRRGNAQAGTAPARRSEEGRDAARRCRGSAGAHAAPRPCVLARKPGDLAPAPQAHGAAHQRAPGRTSPACRP
ncbi:MAG: hypothetical protein WDO13_13835 [Verrucomicrobiota bacterium]